jgi:hypothetical protein
VLRPAHLLRVLAIAAVAASPALSVEGPRVAGAPIPALDAAASDAGQPLVGRADGASTDATARPRRAPDLGGRALVAALDAEAAVAPPRFEDTETLRPLPGRGRSLASARTSRGPPSLV